VQNFQLFAQATVNWASNIAECCYQLRVSSVLDLLILDLFYWINWTGLTLGLDINESLSNQTEQTTHQKSKIRLTLNKKASSMFYFIFNYLENTIKNWLFLSLHLESINCWTGNTTFNFLKCYHLKTI